MSQERPNKGTQLSMTEVQDVALQILKEVATICENNSIQYFLTYGTLLGAIRHKGFIPWDDDVDIMMPRPDYERFCNYFKEHSEEVYPYKLFNLEVCSDYPYMISRISDDRYEIKVNNEKEYGMGVFIDIYPLDGLGNEYDKAYAVMKSIRKYPRLFFLSTRKYYHIGTTKGVINCLIKIPAFFYAKLMGKKYFERKILSAIDGFNYEQSKYVGCAVWGSGTKIFIFEKTDFVDFKMQQFVDGEFRIPFQYNQLLKQWYGDYMQLPPEKDRIYHHLYKAYKK